MVFFKMRAKIIMSIGKMIAASKPAFKLSLNAPATKPTNVGPDEQPKSPARAKNANIVVAPLGHFSAAMLNTPGHKTPTEKPQMPQPISDNIGHGENTMTR